MKVVELDVADDASVEQAISGVLTEAGKIDVLIKNAGIASFIEALGLGALANIAQ